MSVHFTSPPPPRQSLKYQLVNTVICQFLSLLPLPLISSFTFPLPLTTGWWMVDAEGMIGWAPASFLVPVDEEDLSKEAKENEQIVGWEKGEVKNGANSIR